MTKSIGSISNYPNPKLKIMRNKHSSWQRKLLFLTVVSLHLVLLFTFNQATSADNQEARTIPKFLLKDINGKEINSEQLKGHITILDFWTTWCEPCIKEIPALNKLQEKYAKDGLKIFAITVQSGWSKDIKPKVTRYKIQYPVLVGDDEIVSQYQVIGFPTTFVIDPAGNIYRKYFGSPANKIAELEQDINELINSHQKD